MRSSYRNCPVRPEQGPICYEYRMKRRLCIPVQGGKSRDMVSEAKTPLADEISAPGGYPPHSERSLRCIAFFHYMSSDWTDISDVFDSCHIFWIISTSAAALPAFLSFILPQKVRKLFHFCAVYTGSPLPAESGGMLQCGRNQKRMTFPEGKVTAGCGNEQNGSE